MTTHKQLDELAELINKITNSPMDGIGSHKIYNQSLVVIVNEYGAISTIVSSSNTTKNESYERINSFMMGLQYKNMYKRILIK